MNHAAGLGSDGSCLGVRHRRPCVPAGSRLATSRHRMCEQQRLFGFAEPTAIDADKIGIAGAKSSAECDATDFLTVRVRLTEYVSVDAKRNDRDFLTGDAVEANRDVRAVDRRRVAPAGRNPHKESGNARRTSLRTRSYEIREPRNRVGDITDAVWCAPVKSL